MALAYPCHLNSSHGNIWIAEYDVKNQHENLFYPQTLAAACLSWWMAASANISSGENDTCNSSKAWTRGEEDCSASSVSVCGWQWLWAEAWPMSVWRCDRAAGAFAACFQRKLFNAENPAGLLNIPGFICMSVLDYQQEAVHTEKSKFFTSVKFLLQCHLQLTGAELKVADTKWLLTQWSG